jgi:hypothetical protein
MMIITYYLSFYMLITGVTMFNDTSWMTEIILLYSKVAFVSDLRQVGGFLWELRFPPPIKLTANDITEILLKVALNTITLTLILY